MTAWTIGLGLVTALAMLSLALVVGTILLIIFDEVHRGRYKLLYTTDRNEVWTILCVLTVVCLALSAILWGVYSSGV